MANFSKAFSVLSRACDRLARMGVVDVHQRITARILPPEKCGAEDRALELAEEAIAELHQRGLEVLARVLSVELEVPPLAPARLAGSTPVEPDFLSPPPIARAIGAAVLRAADALFPSAGPQGEPVIDPPPHPDGSPRGTITDERAAGMLAPEAPVPPVSPEVKFGEGLGAGAEVGIDLASGPDVTAVVPAPEVPPRHPEQTGYTEAELAEIDRELAAEDAQRRAAPPAPSTPADRDQAEHIEDVVGGAPEAPSAPAAP